MCPRCQGRALGAVTEPGSVHTMENELSHDEVVFSGHCRSSHKRNQQGACRLRATISMEKINTHCTQKYMCDKGDCIL